MMMIMMMMMIIIIIIIIIIKLIRIFLEKLIVPQLVKQSLNFIKSKGSSERSEHPADFSILSQLNPVHVLPSNIFTLHFNIIFLFIHRQCKLFFLSALLTTTQQAILLSSMRATCQAHLILPGLVTGTIFCQAQ